MVKIIALDILLSTLLVSPCVLAQESAADLVQASGLEGGLIVQLGFDDGKQLSALCIRDSLIVQGLDTDLNRIKKARAYIRSLGLNGTITADLYDGQHLPYADNLVNLIVVEKLGKVTRFELMRVLCPGGVLYCKQRGKWHKTVKPWPDDIDQWTHYLYDATGNAVSRDVRVGPPKHLQWVGSPKWSRHHDHITSLNALVSARGRIFSIIDQGSRASVLLPAKWNLVAQDAFNGIVLWKRPITPWISQLWGLKAGPAQLPRRLVAVGNHVYVTLGIGEPISVLDAATGEVLRTLDATKGAEELIISSNTLFAVASDDIQRWLDYRPESTYVWANQDSAQEAGTWKKIPKRIVAVDLKTHKLKWESQSPVVQLTLASDAAGVYFYDGNVVRALDRQSGNEKWTSGPLPGGLLTAQTGARLLLYEGILAFTGGGDNWVSKPVYCVISTADGSTLWSEPMPRSGHKSPYDLFAAHGRIWAGDIVARSPDTLTGRDQNTGVVRSEIQVKKKGIFWFHPRCHPSKATTRFVIPSRTGIELVDYRDGSSFENHWVRGSCLYGIMPANGLIYAPPHACSCYLEGKLNGFNALAPAPSVRRSVKAGDRLERGPAYNTSTPGSSNNNLDPSSDWPTYRHDAARSGSTLCAVSSDLKESWQTKLGGKLSSPVISNGRVFVTSVNTHTVHALNQDNGTPLWHFIAGGRVDSPPTILHGRVYFGCADGWVYCLRESDGALIWRFRAAPEEHKIMAYGQLESAWPVHGSVLARSLTRSDGRVSGEICCVAGRSSFLDGGMRLLRLDAESGQLLSETRLNNIDPETGKDMHYSLKSLTMLAALPDVLSCDGNYIYMRSRRFRLDGTDCPQAELADSSLWKWMYSWKSQINTQEIKDPELAGAGQHLFSPIGFLDDSDFYRSYWLYGKVFTGGWWGWYKAGRIMPSGKLLVFDQEQVYGFGREPAFLCQSAVQEYQIFAADKHTPLDNIRKLIIGQRSMKTETPDEREPDAEDWAVRERFEKPAQSAVNYCWRVRKLPLRVTSLVLAGETLFAAGPPDVVDERTAFRQQYDSEVHRKLREQEEAFAGKHGAILWALSAKSGKLSREYRLSSPSVWDGMAAAGGRLYISALDGTIQCWAASRSRE